MIPLRPTPFPKVNRKALPADTELRRVHSSAFDSKSFNPCLGRPSRFAPLRQPDSTCVPTAHAAQSFECAVHEVIFHDVPPGTHPRSVPLSAIEPLSYGIIRSRRALTLASLHEPDLNAFGLDRRDLIDTLPSEYGQTAKWPLAIHDAHPDIEGLIWTSRRCDPYVAYVLFGDRIAPGDFDVLRKAPITDTPDLLRQVREFGQRAGIFISI